MRCARRGRSPALSRRLGAALAALLVVAPGSPLPPVRAAPLPDRPAAGVPGVKDRYIVVLQDDVAPAARRAGGSARDHALAHHLTPDTVYEHALAGYAAHIPASRLAQVKADPRVRLVAPDRVISLPLPARATPSAAAAPGTLAAGQQATTGLRRIGGSSDGRHQTLANDGAGIGIAVIDSGIDLTHPDLRRADGSGVVGAKTCVPNDASMVDQVGHGTFVAGIIAARDDAGGVVGVAPQATLYAVKVFPRAPVTLLSWIICGVDWVTANSPAHGGPIQVANMSLGGLGLVARTRPDCDYPFFDPLHGAICRSRRAGVTYVVAAGNEPWNVAALPGIVPAAYDEVITVSGLADFDGAPGGRGQSTCYPEVDDSLADFSAFGLPIDLAAPAVCITSTVPRGSCQLCHPSGYSTLSGTSAAAPYVAGAAALYINQHRLLTGQSPTPEQVRRGLLLNRERLAIPGDPDGWHEGVLRIPFLLLAADRPGQGR